MFLRFPDMPMPHPASGPASPLNGAWIGRVSHAISGSHSDHIVFVAPLGERRVGVHQWGLPGHPLTLTRETGPRPSIVLWISLPFLAEFESFLALDRTVGTLGADLPFENSPAVERAIDAIARTWAADDAELFSDACLDVVGRWLADLRARATALDALADHRPTTARDLARRLGDARRYLEANYASPIVTGDVAREIGLSEAHFARLFRAVFDVTVRQFLIRVRIDAARLRLQDPAARVTDVSLDVGYGSLSSFVHTFSRVVGETPSAYQRRWADSQDSTIGPAANPVGSPLRTAEREVR